MIHKTWMIAVVALFFNSSLANAQAAQQPSHILFCKEITKELVDGTYNDQDIIKIAKKEFSGKTLDLSEQNLSKTLERVKQASRGSGFAQIESTCVSHFKNSFTSVVGDILAFMGGTKNAAVTPPSDEVDKASDALIKGSEILKIKIKPEVKPEVPELCKEKIKKEEDEQCGSTPPLLTESVEDLENVVVFHNPSANPYSEEDCLCYLSKNKSNKAKVIANALEESNQIDHAILRASGKKFLNEYAKFYEDILFYESSTPSVLKEDGKNEIASQVLCNDSSAFKKLVDETCAANGTGEIKEARINEILGAFGDDFSHSKNDFGASFNGMIQDIENISYTPNASSGSDTSKPMNYTREAFEGSRLGFSEKLGEVSTVDEISAIIVKDKEMKAKLDKLILNFGQPISPLAAIEKLLSQNSDKSLIKKILRKVGGKKNTKVVSRLNKALEEGNFDAVRAEVFNKGLTYHPGLKNILLDPALFNRASENLKTGDKSLVMSAQSNKDFVDHFGQRCESLQKKFAEAVCVKTADLKSKVSKQEMITVLANDKILNSSNGENREAINLTLCAMSYNQVSMGSAFSGFLPNEPFSVSDYQDRKEHRSFEDQNNIFSNYAKLNAQKSPMSEQINNVASSVSYGRHSSGQLKSSSASNISEAPSLFGAKHLDDRAMVDSLGSTKLTSPTNSSGNTAVKDVESSTPERLDSNPVTDKSSYQVSNITPSTPQFTNSVTPTISKTTEVKEQPTNDEQVSPSREELKNSFTGKEQKKIDGYLSNISDADAQELNRYRAESKKEREAVTDSRLELERLKTLELKAQYEELEKKLALLKKEKSSLADNNSSSGSSNSGGYQEANQEQEKGISNFSGKTNTTNFQATGGSASGNSSAIGGNTQASGQFRDPSSNSNATTGRDLSGKVADGMSLVIKSQAGNGQASAEDPSSELITYLTKNETDSKTLRDLKESGLIYTYEVNENGATVQKKKVIKYTELSVEAKALVDKKISILVEKESSDLERQITSLKRTYSIQALKLEILSSNQSGSLN